MRAMTTRATRVTVTRTAREGRPTRARRATKAWAREEAIGEREVAGAGARARERAAAVALAVVVAVGAPAHEAVARLEGVNNPSLLPPGEPVPVLDVAGYLGKSDIARLTREVEALERDTGMKLRVLAQAYPQTPGLAVKEYWNVDDDTVVFVADPGLGNILNFSVGGNIDLEIPPSFWTRLANKYGTKFYWSDKGEEASISAAVNAVDLCAREPQGRAKCSKIADYDDGVAVATDFDAPTSGGVGGFLGGLFK